MIMTTNKKKAMSTTIRLGDLHIGIPEAGKKPGDRARKPITDSPYYQSLKTNNPGLFQRYAQWTSTPSKNTWRNFMSVYDSIRRTGFNPKLGHPVVIVHDGTHWQVVNGHHRVAILRRLYGADGQVVLGDGKHISKVLGTRKPHAPVLPIPVAPITRTVVYQRGFTQWRKTKKA